MERMIPYSSEENRAAQRSDYEDFLRMNLHNHSTFSDGIFAPEAIVRKAIAYGLNYVGITDHYLTRKVRSMDNYALERYIEAVGELKNQYSRDIRVLAGVEVDSSRDRTNFDSVRYDLLNSLDYVLFEYVNDDLWEGMHLWELFDIVKKIEVPCGLAHNDISRNFREIDYDALLNVLEDSRIFVELSSSPRNSKFGRPYYRFAVDFFGRLSGTEVQVSIGTDTHTNLEEVGEINDAVAFVEEMRLEENLITRVL